MPYQPQIMQPPSPQAVNLRIKGLYTAPNDFTGVPDGALDTADDIVIDQESLAEPRRGFSYVPGSFPNTNDRANNFVNFQSVQIASYSNSNLAYYSAGAWNTYPGTYLPPDSSLAQTRFFEANQNLYFSTSSGVWKLDTYTATPVKAGVPKGLDLQVALTGASGFLGTNIAATLTGTTAIGSANLTLLSSLASVSFGQFILGAGISPGTTVSSITQSAQVLITTGSTTAGSTALSAVPTNAGLSNNQLITGAGIPSGSRIQSISGVGPYVVTMTQSAIATNTAIAVSFASDPIITMSSNATASASVSLTFSAGSQVAYRLIWGIKDANQNLLYGSPTQFSSITNNTGGTSNAQATSSIPAGITTAYFYQLYRSAQTAASSITPLDDMQLVYEGNPNSTDLTNGYIQITDITPDSLRGAFLYTGISQQGISQSNDPPPFCKDFCAFKNYAFYANTKAKQRLTLTFLAVGAPNGLQVGDTISVGGVIFTAANSENTATGNFQVFSSGTPAQNIANTVNSLIKIVNRYTSNTAVYAYLISGPTDLPGQILFEEQGNGGSTFYAFASAHGTAYTPALPTSGTTIKSTQATNKNGILVSKSGQPESVPGGNLFFVGSASKEILRIIPLRDYVIILKQDGIFRLSGLTIQTFLVSPFDLTTKLLAPNTAVTLSNEVWGLFDQGVCSVSDTGVQVRSRAIENILRSLIGTALNTIKNIGFGVGYETDRKYILALPANNGDTACQQEFVFSTFTNAWVRWTRICTAGFIDPSVNKLYIGNGSVNNVSVENKTDTYADYVEESFPITIVSATNQSIVVNTTANVSIGDVLSSSSTVFSVIMAIDPIALILTVQDSLVWVPGVASILPAIKSVIQWKPVVAGNPAYVRQYSEGVLLFKRTKFNTGTISFYSDVDQSFEDTTLQGSSVGTWGTFGWGLQNWGGVNRPKPIRFLVPQNKQMCSQLSPRLIMRVGYSNWACEGIALKYQNVSEEVA